MSETKSETTVHGLLCHKHVPMALACLGSLLRYSAEPLRLVIHDDGSLTSDDVAQLNKGLKNSTVISRSEANELMDQHLSGYPNAAAYRYEHALSLKLLDIALLETGDIAYCDSDILFFRPFSGLFKLPNSEISSVFMMDYRECYSVYPWTILGSSQLKLPSKANTGVMYIRKSDYDLDLIEWFLGRSDFRYIPSWVEQTCWAALGHRIGSQLCSPKQIAVIQPTDPVPTNLVAGHFTSRVRYRLKDFLLQANDNSTESPVRVEKIAPANCHPLDLGYCQFRRELQRMPHQTIEGLRRSKLGHYKRQLSKQLVNFFEKTSV